MNNRNTPRIPRRKAGARILRWLTVLPVLAHLPLRAAPTDFTVTSPVDGSTFRLSEAKGRMVALHFLLKTECPVCIRHTREYAQRAPELPGVVQIFLKPDSEEEIRRWAGKVSGDPKARITIHRDADAALAKAYEIPDGYRFHGETVHYPALVLLDGEGKEVFRYVGKNNTDRLPFDKLAARVVELGGVKREPARKPDAGKPEGGR